MSVIAKDTQKSVLFYFFIDFLSLLEDLVSALKAEIQGAGA